MIKQRLAVPANHCWTLIGLLVLLGTWQPGQAQISIVVARSAALDSNSLKPAEIKEIYSGNKLKWPNGAKIQVVDQAETEVGKKFYETLMGRSFNQVRQQWNKLMLSGQASAPLQCPSDKAVKKVIASRPYAIGYILTSSLDNTVKEILRLPLKPAEEK
ncbi:MAG: hypothetical protein ONB48_20745 [candidate division KSB1 bacterium]|nr:hypothetical protein [candidate division KSB1 bacterium]MDZ7276406.1 hypothetical protein [candidate division KSB1 bacterium]MDZ7288077.1 hypothetical protein [candidate division KSB1 bacterium]MDZ7300177.1 hypothetical protein [candidate division KSB1 bacterium]MDZ7305749.1 hypothetical protein [candidate division KSB1 bacterium]